jgi:hypothetical protein
MRRVDVDIAPSPIGRGSLNVRLRVESGLRLEVDFRTLRSPPRANLDLDKLCPDDGNEVGALLAAPRRRPEVLQPRLNWTMYPCVHDRA